MKETKSIEKYFLTFLLSERSEDEMNELRRDPILGSWVIISPGRGRRPQTLARPGKTVKKRSITCPLCPGNETQTPLEVYARRARGARPNTPGWKLRVVPNKFPALNRDGELVKKRVGMFNAMSGFGVHEVIVETPDHDKNLNNQSIKELSEVLKTFQHRIEDLYRDKHLRYCLIFKNEGWEAGASLEHPHSQLIATPVIPQRLKEELLGSKNYFKLKRRCIYCDILSQEKESGERIVYENKEYLSFCPFASRFPFEIWLLPKKHNADFSSQATSKSIFLLADALRTTMRKLVLTLNNPQYNYVIHTAPNRFSESGSGKVVAKVFHWHIEIIPRLTRAAGSEWGADFYLNPSAPEAAARSLRHANNYKSKKAKKR